MDDTQALMEALGKKHELIEEAQTMFEVMGIQPAHPDAGEALLAFFTDGPLPMPEDVSKLAEKENIDWNKVARFIIEANR
jgi:hypothetical protein